MHIVMNTMWEELDAPDGVGDATIDVKKEKIVFKWKRLVLQLFVIVAQNLRIICYLC